MDYLLDRSIRCVTVLDISGAALARARERLGPRQADVKWIEADVTGEWTTAPVDIWHDRAVFHFLTTAADRDRYRAQLLRTVRHEGSVICPGLGEHKANMIGSHAVPLRICTVSFKSATGISHSVDVEAETLYEAAGIGLARLKKDGWIEGLGPGSRLEIAVREPSTIHSLTVQQLQRWANGVTSSPAEVLRRTKVKHLLGM